MPPVNGSPRQPASSTPIPTDNDNREVQLYNAGGSPSSGSSPSTYGPNRKSPYPNTGSYIQVQPVIHVQPLPVVVVSGPSIIIQPVQYNTALYLSAPYF